MSETISGVYIMSDGSLGPLSHPNRSRGFEGIKGPDIMSEGFYIMSEGFYIMSEGFSG
jgi:hypothetical protein